MIAFDRRRFAGDVLAKQRMEATRRARASRRRRAPQGAETLAHGDDIDPERRCAYLAAVATLYAGEPRSCDLTNKASDVATAPNTPHCIFTILMAWS
jgi:hypothetical protein